LNGFTVSKQEPHCYAETISRALSDRKRLARIANNALRVHHANFSEKKTVENTIKVYKTAIKKRR